MNPAACKIEKGIPIPARAQKYPLRAMKVGDSFLLPRSDNDNACHGARTSADYVARSIAGFRITIRKTPRGFRVWRIA